MGMYSPSHNDSHPTALAAGIPLHQSFRAKGRSMSLQFTRLLVGVG